MGGAKQEWEASLDRGYRLPQGVVCSMHFIDPLLVQTVMLGGYASTCDFCDRTGPEIAANLADVVAVIGDAFWEYWSNPDDEGIIWDAEEQQWFAELESIESILDWEFKEIVTDDTEIWERIVECFPDGEVCRRGYFRRTREQALRFGWRDFTERLKHDTRYVFLVEQSDVGTATFDDEGIPPSAMLERLGKLVFDHALVNEIDAGHVWYRARVHNCDAIISTATELGTAPRKFANTSNRMSPAGIPMFYGSLDVPTALAETWPETMADLCATTGAFASAREMTLIDLTELPDVPSILDLRQRTEREELIFLHDFVRDISAEIVRDGREHVDYVPTQVVTEYFRRVWTWEKGHPHGIMYRSAKTTSGVCCVLFVSNEGCADTVDGWDSIPEKMLGLDRDSLERHRRAEIPLN